MREPLCPFCEVFRLNLGDDSHHRSLELFSCACVGSRGRERIVPTDRLALASERTLQFTNSNRHAEYSIEVAQSLKLTFTSRNDYLYPVVRIYTQDVPLRRI